jgi:hypothetical protein
MARRGTHFALLVGILLIGGWLIVRSVNGEDRAMPPFLSGQRPIWTYAGEDLGDMRSGKSAVYRLSRDYQEVVQEAERELGRRPGWSKISGSSSSTGPYAGRTIFSFNENGTAYGRLLHICPGGWEIGSKWGHLLKRTKDSTGVTVWTHESVEERRGMELVATRIRQFFGK